MYRAKGHPRKYRFCSLLLIAGEIVKDYEYMKKLERNLIDNILESEVKLGRTNSSITFYYPEDSLTELLDCSSVELPLKIAAFIENEEDHLDNIIIEELGNEKGRYAVKISEKALDWVHNNYQPSDFMKEFVEEIRKPDKTLEGIAELFRKYSPEVVISKVNTDEWAFAFKEDTIDPYVYHIEQNIFGLEYHRFTRQAYEKMMCGINK